MMKFDAILARAVARAGGPAELEDRLPMSATREELEALPDDRYLSQMSLRIFRAGLKHSMVDSKWPAFEEAFYGFDPHRIRAMAPEDLESMMGDRRLIRHWGKLKSIPVNAEAMLAVRNEKKCFGTYLADWPGAEIVDLWVDLKKRFSQLGGSSGPTFLRMVGKDTFLLTDDVVAVLVEAGVVQHAPSSMRDRAAAQAAFNQWVAESGRPLCQISRILALAAG